MTSPAPRQSLLHLLYFPFFYLWEIVAGALRISWDVFHPRPKLAPVLVHVPTGTLTHRQRLALACLVTMTPGTLSVDLVEDDSTLVVHGLYARDHPEALLATIQNRYRPAVERLPL